MTMQKGGVVGLRRLIMNANYYSWYPCPWTHARFMVTEDKVTENMHRQNSCLEESDTFSTISLT